MKGKEEVQLCGSAVLNKRRERGRCKGIWTGWSGDAQEQTHGYLREKVGKGLLVQRGNRIRPVLGCKYENLTAGKLGAAIATGQTYSLKDLL